MFVVWINIFIYERNLQDISNLILLFTSKQLYRRIFTLYNFLFYIYISSFFSIVFKEEGERYGQLYQNNKFSKGGTNENFLWKNILNDVNEKTLLKSKMKICRIQFNKDTDSWRTSNRNFSITNVAQWQLNARLRSFHLTIRDKNYLKTV